MSFNESWWASKDVQSRWKEGQKAQGRKRRRDTGLPGLFTQDEGDWLRSALQALPSPASEDGSDIRLPGIGRGIWGTPGVGDSEGGVRDAPHIGVS